MPNPGEMAGRWLVGTPVTRFTANLSLDRLLFLSTSEPATSPPAEVNTAVENAANPQAPVNLTLPVIAGETTVGAQLTLSLGSWDNNPTAFARQWLRNGGVIVGATAETYVLVEADEGTDIGGKVTAFNSHGDTDALAAEVGPIGGNSAINTRQELLDAIAASQPVIILGTGSYGDITIVNKPNMTITGPPTAWLRTLNIDLSPGIRLQGFGIDWTAQSGDGAKTNVIYIDDSAGCTIDGLTMVGHPVPPGTPGALDPNAVPPPPLGSFLVGYPAGSAINLSDSPNSTVINCDISGFFQGVVCLGSNNTNLTLDANYIHDLRTTPIKGYIGSNSTINYNRLEHSVPYRYANDTQGDHLDFIHPFINAGYPAISDLEIVGNLMDPMGAYPAIGILLEDNAGHASGFPNATLSNNTYLAGQTQAFSLDTGSITANGNTLLAPPGSSKWPTIIQRNTTLTTSGNTLYDTSTQPKLSSTQPNNTYLPNGAVSADIIADARAAALALISENT